jgi:hypothetical protein
VVSHPLSSLYYHCSTSPLHQPYENSLSLFFYKYLVYSINLMHIVLFSSKKSKVDYCVNREYIHSPLNVGHCYPTNDTLNHYTLRHLATVNHKKIKKIQQYHAY